MSTPPSPARRSSPSPTIFTRNYDPTTGQASISEEQQSGVLNDATGAPEYGAFQPLIAPAGLSTSSGYQTDPSRSTQYDPTLDVRYVFTTGQNVQVTANVSVYSNSISFFGLGDHLTLDSNTTFNSISAPRYLTRRLPC